MRIYLADQQSYEGRELAAVFTAAEHELMQSDAASPNSFLTADVIILDLVRAEIESTRIITAIKDSEELDHPITLIALSSVMTWARSQKRNLREQDYKARQPSVRFSKLKMAESLVLSLAKENVSPYVVAAGLLYGKGEDVLHSLFRSAWMGERKLRVIGDGENIIPTLHVTDFARIVARVADEKPEEKQYIVAVDKSRTTQLALVQAVSTHFAYGEVEFVDKNSEDVLLDQSGTVEPLLADISFDPDTQWITELNDLEWTSENGVVDPESMAQVKAEFIKARNLRPLRLFVYGPPASGKTNFSQRVASAYYLPHIRITDAIAEALERNDELSEAIRRFTEEAPAAGAATAAAAKKGASAGAAGGKKTPNPPAKGAAASGKPSPASPAAAAPAKKKSTGKLSARAEAEAANAARIPVKLLTRALKQKLSSPACVNQGFVLDGYPRTYGEAKALFKLSPSGDASEDGEEEENGEDLDEDGKEANLDPKTIVDGIVKLNITREQGEARTKALPAALQTYNHHDELGFNRRWNRWEQTQAAVIEDPNFASPLVFLEKTPAFPPLELTEELQTLMTMPNSATNPVEVGLTDSFPNGLRLYIERHGKPFNYHPTPQELAAKEALAAETERAARVAHEQQMQALEEKESSEREARERQNDLRREQLLQEEQELVEAASLPLRKFLMANVIPALVSGLADVCRVQPSDPVDHLAEFLFKYSVGDSASTVSSTPTQPQDEAP